MRLNCLVLIKRYNTCMKIAKKLARKNMQDNFSIIITTFYNHTSCCPTNNGSIYAKSKHWGTVLALVAEYPQPRSDYNKTHNIP